MKNVTKILIAVTLCAAVFASTQRIGALGGNAAFWPGDEANIAAFPAQINNHGYLQLTGAGEADGSAGLVFNHNGTAWSLGFSNDNDTWFDLGWGKGDMGINVAFHNSDAGFGSTGGAALAQSTSSGFIFGYGNEFSWGELGFHYTSGSDDTVTTAFEGSECSNDVDGGTLAECDNSTVLVPATDCVYTDTDASGTVNAGDTCTGGVPCEAWVDTDTATDCTDVEATPESGGDPNTLTYTAQIDRVVTGADWNANGISINFRKACEFWVFTDMVASLNMPDEGDMSLTADWFTHMDAGGADVMFATGISWADGDMGHLTQTAAIGVEANMTDWASLRAGVNWAYQLAGENDMVGGVDSTDDDEDDYDNGDGYGWNVGVGFNWGGLTADYNMGNGSFLMDPVAYITGNNATDAANDGLTDHTVTLTYSF
jgi:hypothetical protein